MFPARIGPAGADVARLLGALLGALLGDGDALPITGATRGRGEGGREGGKKGEGGPATGMLRGGTGPGGGTPGWPGSRRMEQMPRFRDGKAARSCQGRRDRAGDGDVKRPS